MKEKRNTLQKQIVSDVFFSMNNHPSAGMVYEAVAEKYPGISRATVYRLLAEAAEEGRIQRLKLVDANDRYDVTVCKHHHIVCRCCGHVADVCCDLNVAELSGECVRADGFDVEDYHVEFVGICDKCRTKI